MLNFASTVSGNIYEDDMWKGATEIIQRLEQLLHEERSQCLSLFNFEKGKVKGEGHHDKTMHGVEKMNRSLFSHNTIT